MDDGKVQRPWAGNDVGAMGSVVRLLTWNINGLRKVAAGYGSLKALLDQFEADVVEHNLARAQGYHCLFSHCKVPRKPSYSGVATFVRSESGLRTIASTNSLADAAFFGSPGSFARGLSPDRLTAIDSEGRVLVTDHGHFVLFNVYAPCISDADICSACLRDGLGVDSSGDEDDKTEERRKFKRDFLAMLEARIFEIQERACAVLLVGDLNLCVSQMDHGFTMTDAEFYASNWSKWIRSILGLNPSDPPRLVDCFRRLHPDRKNAFTCWNTVTGARENNYGTRIDYILAGIAFAEQALEGCDIMPQFLGSDHCPVRARFNLLSEAGCKADKQSDGTDTRVLHAGEWREHPPECSCFYEELAAKQEKLAKYFFVTSDSNSAARAGAAGGGAANGVGREPTDDIERENLSMTVGSSGGEDTRSRQMISTMLARDSRDGGRHVLRGKKTVSEERSRCRKEKQGHRNIGSSRARQSKLTFASSSSRTLSRDSAKPRAVPSRHMRGDRKREIELAPGMHLGGSGVADSTNPEREPDIDDGVSDSRSQDVSAEAWRAIFGRNKSTPPCEHGEPSIQRTVLKPGQNHNRRFYTCARSAGNWPIDRNARCNFFQWRLDGVKGYKDRLVETDAKRQRRF